MVFGFCNPKTDEVSLGYKTGNTLTVLYRVPGRIQVSSDKDIHI